MWSLNWTALGTASVVYFNFPQFRNLTATISRSIALHKIFWPVYPLLGNDSINIPARANAGKNRTTIARQRISKHASLTIEAVISAGSVQSDYKEVSGSIEEFRRTVKSQVSRRQPAGIWIELSLRDWQLQNNGKKWVRLWKEYSCVIWSDIETVINPLPGYD
jgi:hypothetical protein